MNCKICLDLYNESRRRPRMLPCGHSFCSPCIKVLQEDDVFPCPTCRAEHAAGDHSEFPIAFEMEELLAKMRIIMEPSQKPCEKNISCLSKRLLRLKREQEASMGQTSVACERIRQQLAKYCARLEEWEEEHWNLGRDLLKVIQLNEEAETLLTGERAAVQRLNLELEEKMLILEQATSKLSDAASEKETFDALNQGDVVEVEAMGLVRKSEELFPDMDVLHKSTKIRSSLSSALNQIIHQTKDCSSVLTRRNNYFSDVISVAPLFLDEKLTEDSESGASQVDVKDGDIAPEGEDCDDLGEVAVEEASSDISSMSILERVHHMQLTAPVDITNESLKLLEEPVRAMLEAGEVFAMQTRHGVTRYSKIALEDGKVLLNHLQETPPTTHFRAIQFDEIVVDSYKVFLKLSYPGSRPKRVTISLFNDRGLSNQFKMLCTGEKGPCYAGTNLYSVHKTDFLGEQVWGGDYECNDGTGGRNICEDLTGEERRGSIGHVISGNPRRSCFGIITRNSNEHFTILGSVVEGLKAVLEAAAVPVIKKVKISECGLVMFDENA